MDLHKLELEGIGSYIEKTELDFNKLKLALIKGGNGSGKSWLLDAIAWALYDETIRGYKKDEAINNIVKEGRVNLFLSDEKNRTILIDRRRKTDKGDATVSIDGITKYGTLPEMQKIIIDLIGMNFTLFRNSCMFGQNDLIEFASTTDKGRKDIIGYLVGFDELDIWLEKVRKVKGITEKTLEALTTAISINMQQISKVVVEDIEQLERDITELKIRLGILEERKNKIQANTILLDKKLGLESKREGIIKQIDVLKEEIKNNEQALTQKEATFTLLASINGELGKCEEELSKQPGLKTEEENCRKILSEISNRKSVAESLLRQYRDELDEITNLNSGVCSKCRQSVTTDWLESQKSIVAKNAIGQDKEVKIFLDGYKEEGIKLQEILAKEKALDKIRENKEELLRKQGQLLAKVTLIEKIEKDLEIQGTKLSLLNEGSVAVDKELKEIVVEDIDRNEIFTVSKELIEKQSAKDSLQERKTIAQQQINLKKQLEDSLSKNEGERKVTLWKLEINKVLEEALGQSGIRNILIESLIPIMEQKANEYLTLLLDGVTVSFDTKVEGKTVIKDEFAILITDSRGREPVTRSFKGWSGGEKLLIALVLRLVLWNIGYMKSKTRMNFILMDEILGCLEQKNREKVIELLVKLNSELNVKILLIEHLEELEERFPQVISVTNNGGSKIEWIKE